jgi:hypothetical protein
MELTHMHGMDLALVAGALHPARTTTEPVSALSPKESRSAGLDESVRSRG